MRGQIALRFLLNKDIYSSPLERKMESATSLPRLHETSDGSAGISVASYDICLLGISRDCHKHFKCSVIYERRLIATLRKFLSVMILHRHFVGVLFQP